MREFGRKNRPHIPNEIRQDQSPHTAQKAMWGPKSQYLWVWECRKRLATLDTRDTKRER